MKEECFTHGVLLYAKLKKEMISHERVNRIYSLCFKRIFDLLLTLSALFFLLPVFIAVALLVRFQMGSPVLFKQVRPGGHEKPFTLFKFRTMTDARGADGALLPDSVRLTRLGRFLRATSLDELPELWNVLKGDMSLVGPRPLLMRYLEYFNKEERIRFTVRPGITGLAQISGRNDLSWDKRLLADIQYVQKISFLRDLKILAFTVLRVFKKQGVRTDPSIVMLDLDEERRNKQ